MTTMGSNAKPALMAAGKNITQQPRLSKSAPPCDQATENHLDLVPFRWKVLSSVINGLIQ